MYGNLSYLLYRPYNERAGIGKTEQKRRPATENCTHLLAKAFWLLGGNWDGEQLIGQMTYKRHYL
jgi:hypothetical protein